MLSRYREIYIYPVAPEYSDDLEALGRELHKFDAVDDVRPKPAPERPGGGLIDLLVVVFGAGGTVTVAVKAVIEAMTRTRTSKARSPSARFDRPRNR